ncbi:sulfotransferase [Rhodoblastus sp.]|jgi:hypothetical protein|uniref:sulfotransferase family protein n=1 Tax=Rhodoblastus sp. TaxID=1962975 RepID=UPI00261DD5CA|nr:sulfotransferase [Rhodoblastus sp.]
MPIRGSVECKDAQVISGWIAVTPGDAPPRIEIMVGGKAVGVVVASEPRPDVRAAGIGDGNCGFTFHMPPDIDPVLASSAQLRLVGTEIYLDRSRSSPESNPGGALPGEGSVFILGAARSGTSVVLLAICNVLRLHGFGESHAPQIFQRMSFHFYQYVKQFVGDAGVLAARLPVAELEENLIVFLRRFYAQQFGDQPFVDKTPGAEAIVGAPFIKRAFPGAKIIVMERNGVEVIESYRRKFGASFDDALAEWSSCAGQIAKLKTTMPEILFLSQNELRIDPDTIARKIAEHLGRSEEAGRLADFFRSSRDDVLSGKEAWARAQTLADVDWSEAEKQKYREFL